MTFGWRPLTRRWIPGAASLLLLVAADAQAQTSTPVHAGPLWAISPYVGVAHNSPVTGLGQTPDRNHLFLGIHVTGTLFRWRHWSFAYASEVVPLLIVSDNPTYSTELVEAAGQKHLETQETGSGPVAGFGLSPLGFETQLGLTSRWRVYGGGAGGFVWFTRDVPVPDSREFNYTFEFGGGVQWQLHSNLSLRVGYKFHHLSNAGTSDINPGLNGNVWMVGIARQLGNHR